MLVPRIFYSIVFGLLSLTVNAIGQTCENLTPYSACSTNRECGCLSLSFSDSVDVCGVINTNCSQLSSCQSPDDACEQSKYICVRHPRCDSRSLCYPLSMTGDEICPPKIVSNYSSALAVDDGRYNRPGGSSPNHYYEAIQIMVNITDYYNITSVSGVDTYGFLYNGTFDPHNPYVNLMSRDDDSGGGSQFYLTRLLQAGILYTLVVSTHYDNITGPFTVVASGPSNMHFIPINSMQFTTTTTSTTTLPSVVLSNYSNVLTKNDQTFSRDGNSGSLYYYKAIEVRVTTTGVYTFKTSSSIRDTYGYLYQGNFYPSYLSYNKIAHDDDGSGNGQFQLTAGLRSEITYVIIFTTYSQRDTGSFSIVGSGPGDVSFNAININA